jgi:capsular exopolysaccharide synthesis family protein
MSRIDEALRRAAGNGDATADDGQTAAEPAAGVDLSQVADEPFPVEIAERRKQRAQAIATVLRPAEASSRQTEPGAQDQEPPREAGSTRPKSEASSIFERIDARLAEKVVSDERMSQVSREQYRRLAAILHDAQSTNNLRTIMIASAMPGEGKTLTATNLALTLSESYRNRVLLIDADLRRPTLHQVFRLRTAFGLVEGLDGKEDQKIVLRQVTERLSVLPAGRPTSDPMAALTSPRMRRLVEEAKESFDWIILDTPPLILLPDAHLLSDMVDGTILVVRANATAFEHVKRTVDIIGRDRVTGVVLNQADARAQEGYAYPYYYGHYATSEESRGR